MRNCLELILTLCCAAVLFALAAGALPAEESRAAFCRSNLKAIYQLTAQYEASWGRTPPAIAVHGKRWIFFDAFLRPEAADRRIFACPADRRNAYAYEEESPLFTSILQLAPSYGMNYAFTDQAAAKSGIVPPALAKIKTPRNMVLYADSSLPYMKLPGFWKKGYAPRHRKQSNFMFADGSAVCLSHEQFGNTMEKWQWQ